MSKFDKIKKRIMEYKEIFYIIVGLAVIEAIILIIKFVKWIKKKSVKR
jgi:D-alanyl-D-alanine carboxypeptidase (penicillin-binding protein 5/6)